MNRQQKYVVLGGLGGGALGFFSLVMPTYIKPALHLEGSVTTFIVIGLAILGGFFGYMNAGSR